MSKMRDLAKQYYKQQYEHFSEAILNSFLSTIASELKAKLPTNLIINTPFAQANLTNSIYNEHNKQIHKIIDEICQ